MNHSATNHSAKNNKNQRFGDKEVNSIESAIRYVAYMDVMGFKDMVARNPHDVIGEKLQKFFQKLDLRILGIYAWFFC